MEDTTPLGKMFENGTSYVVPIYQRGYSWKSQQVIEFLEDLSRANDKANHVYIHFFGTMLTTNPNKVPDHQSRIIDGQQRMTTAVLFLLCARNFFYTHKDTSTQAKKHYMFIEKRICSHTLNAKGTRNKSILTLSKPNKDFFQTVLEHHSMCDDIDSVDRFSNDSNKLLNEAYTKIRDWFNDETEDCKSHPTKKLDLESVIESIYNYVITLFQKFVIFNIHCDDESEAQRIFNLVNNRGIRLSPSDLIKNLLFSKLSTDLNSVDIIQQCDTYWNDMRNHITNKQASDYTLDRFFHHYLLAFYSDKIKNITNKPDIITPNAIYDSYDSLLRNNVFQPQEIIRGLREWSHILARLRNPSGTNFLHKDNVIHYLTKIQNIKAVTVYPAILAGYKMYWKEKSYKNFEALVMLCFKYHIRIKVIGTKFTIGDYQYKTHHIMNAINEKTSMQEIINNLVDDPKYYPNQTIVETNLAEQFRISNSRLALALLEEAESLNNKKRSPSGTSIEHIMPVTLNKQWIDYIIENNPDINSPDDVQKFHKQHVHLLGNQTLLSGKVNNPLSNKPYKDKRQAYRDDQTFQMNKMFSDIPVWNSKAIMLRQKDLAKTIVKAIDITKIPSEVPL